MPTDDERREVARRLRGLDDSELQVYDMTYFAIQRAVGGEGDQYPDGRELADRLADLIEPSCDLGPSGWTSFDERPPEPGAPVLCKGKNGAYYVGKPVTYGGERTGKVWVPRGAEYRSPAAWRPVDSPPCDRDALLALADEIERKASNWDVTQGDIPLVHAGYLIGYAERIREALGVTHDV